MKGTDYWCKELGLTEMDGYRDVIIAIQNDARQDLFDEINRLKQLIDDMAVLLEKLDKDN